MKVILNLLNFLFKDLQCLLVRIVRPRLAVHEVFRLPGTERDRGDRAINESGPFDHVIFVDFDAQAGINERM